MHRKTHSKNQFRRIKKVSIAERIIQLKLICRKVIDRYPFYCFVAMFLSILLSAVLAFTSMRVQESTQLPSFPGLATEGIIKTTTDVITSYGTIVELEELQRRIALIIEKDTLSEIDSIHLSDALKRYEYIQRSLIPSNQGQPSP